MSKLITIHTSNYPIECHILKGRLETEGIPCFIHDENLIWVYPFKAVAIGGVKLKVPFNKYVHSKNILNLISQGKLIDATGEYKISEIFDNETKRQNEIFSIKNKIRNDFSLLEKSIESENEFIDKKTLEKIKREEKEFLETSNKRFIFTWKQFFYELFDFDRSIFRYLRTKPVEYYTEKEIVEHHINHKESIQVKKCPNCKSENTSFGHAIDFKWDILYLILSIIILIPFFPIRKKYHCFDCGNNFKIK